MGKNEQIEGEKVETLRTPNGEKVSSGEIKLAGIVIYDLLTKLKPAGMSDDELLNNFVDNIDSLHDLTKQVKAVYLGDRFEGYIDDRVRKIKGALFGSVNTLETALKNQMANYVRLSKPEREDYLKKHQGC